MGCLLAQQEDFEQGSAKDLRTIWEALGSAGNGGMLHLYDHEGSDIEITWNTEEEKKEKWEEVAEILGLAEQAEEQGGEDEGWCRQRDADADFQYHTVHSHLFPINYTGNFDLSI